MKRAIILGILLSLTFSVTLIPASNDIHFNRGIAYLLIEDPELARNHFRLFFQKNPNPTLKGGFNFLVDGNNEDATQKFKNFLSMNHRSTIALVGIALSTANMQISNSIELLKRAIRLNHAYSPAYLCLGMEYLKKKNYPLAEKHFNQALRLYKLPEYKILSSRLYLKLNKPKIALNMVKGEADTSPDNFYFNLLTAKAYLKMNQLSELGKYIEAALDIKPNNNEAKLLMAKYYLNQNNPTRAELILSGIKFESYNEDYMKTYANVLIELKNKKAKNYLYEVFSREKWDKDINRLLGLYYLWIEQTGNVQNWIYRSILSGTEIGRLKELFPGEYKFPEYKFFPFFNVKKIEWISDEVLLLVATRKSGEREKIFIVDLKRMKVVQAMTYNGELQEIFISKNRKNIVFSSIAKENESIYLYSINFSRNNFRLRPIFNRPLNIPSILVGFNSTGTLAYITNSKINSLAFESPFSQVSQFGEKKAIYPGYPFPIYKYYFTSGKFVKLKEMGQLETIPIEAVKKYDLVSNAYYSHSKIQALIESGRQMDLTSSEIVKTYFSKDLTSFIIYLSDLKNAFQGLAWDRDYNKAMPMDETMFLGKGNFAELTIIDFNPGKKEILVLTKNKRELILYNYESHLSTNFTENVSKVHYSRKNGVIYILRTRGKKDGIYFGGSELQVISLKPYLSKTIGIKRNLCDIIDYQSDSEIYFSTYNGEIVKMDDEYIFTYLKPSLEGSILAMSPDAKKKAAYINGRLLIIE